MNRRESIKRLAVGSSMLVAIPAWATNWVPGNLTVLSGTFDANQQALLATVADAIIPAGNSIGAISVGVDKFLVKLFSDCYDKAAQDNIIRGLKTLDQSANEKFSTSFLRCDQKQRQDLFLALNSSETKADQEFFNLMKSETIRGFNTSKEVMQKYLNYKVAPGHYHGCVDVKA